MNKTIEPDVGKRLRHLREQQGLSLRMVSERCGLSINAISQIERGENSPTVASLHRLANALNVQITDFFQPETKQTTVFIRHTTGLKSQANGILMESLGIGLSNQQLEPFRLAIGPGVGNIDDPIAHTGEEFVHCLEGEIEYIVGDQRFQLQQGDSLLFEATQLHAYHNHTSQPATLLVIYQAGQDRHLIRQLHLDNEVERPA
ncbi:MAG: cupin domain-containing protein [Anaerolineales bacterium]|jgi:transcriptional regulator with XRE-family HTH domain